MSCILPQDRYRKHPDVPARGVEYYSSGLDQVEKTALRDRLAGVRDGSLRNYIAYRAGIKKTYHDALVILKLVLVAGLFIMAISCRYTDFIRTHPGQFSAEVAAFLGTALSCYVFFVCYRGVRMSRLDFFKNMGVFLLVTLFVVVCAELGSFETNLGGAAPDDGSEYQKRQSEARRRFPSRVVVSAVVMFVLVFFFIAYRAYTDERYRGALVGGVVLVLIVAFLSQATPYLSDLKKSIGLTSPDWCVGIALGVFLLYALLFTCVLYASVFKIHAINLFSYAATRPRVWEGKDAESSNRIRIFLFLIEAVVVIVLTAIPVFLVGYYRNPRLKRRVFTDRVVVVEFLLLCVKLFLFYVMAQLIGLFDWTNEGYCMDKRHRNILDPKSTAPRPIRLDTIVSVLFSSSSGKNEKKAS